jgi:hypothetical protein
MQVPGVNPGHWIQTFGMKVSSFLAATPHEMARTWQSQFLLNLTAISGEESDHKFASYQSRPLFVTSYPTQYSHGRTCGRSTIPF